MTDPDHPSAPPTRVCRRCSTQSTSAGDFCPQCGASYIRRRRKPGRKTVIALSVAVVLLLSAGAGLALKAKHDRDEERDRAAAESRREDREADEEAREAAEAREERREVKIAAEAAERKVRGLIIRRMQASITKDAKERVADGYLDGPIMYTSCDPLGGGSVDDLTALTTTFDCIAVNDEVGGGRVSGYGFAATVNWNKASWTWQLDG